MVRLGSPRWKALRWPALALLGGNLLLRTLLLLLEQAPESLTLAGAAQVFGVGLVLDAATLSYLLLPVALVVLLVPGTPRGDRLFARLGLLGMALLFGLLAFSAVAEVLFWLEFSSRFNFIAVDYLVYTRELLGNVRESYPLGPILAGVVVAALLALAGIRRPLQRDLALPGGRFMDRLPGAAACVLAALASAALVGDGLRAPLASAAVRELAGNGWYDFVRAFRNADLDYARYYRGIDRGRAERLLRQEFVEAHSSATFEAGIHPLRRAVHPSRPAEPLHVVLVSMESLGADYVGAFGGVPGLTPNLDRLAAEGLAFTQLYATGLRTVRGLEALTLSVPPTPGHAVPVRIHNKGFQTLGSVFRGQGYEPLYIYGGYATFDSMRDFFGGNGYTVLDRTDIPPAAISHETVWGVADEDMYRFALGEIDRRIGAGERVFAHLMTTSNHRPFTFPDGRIDLASGSGREAAVKYADWALGDFMRRAAGYPWFRDTLFVVVADHTSHGRGRTDLPPENYRIPLVLWSPAHLAPARIDTLASQIDVAPTVLAALGFSYESEFFGQDILTEGRFHPRALLANYVTVGYMEAGMVVELSPHGRVRVLDARSGAEVAPTTAQAAHLTEEAISYYEVADEVLRGGGHP